MWFMEEQTKPEATFPLFVQQLIDGGERKGKLDALLRLLARAGIALSEDERARIQACTEIATLDRWIENVLGAHTANDVLT